jgi:hypothetical protein
VEIFGVWRRYVMIKLQTADNGIGANVTPDFETPVSRDRESIKWTVVCCSETYTTPLKL